MRGKQVENKEIMVEVEDPKQTVYIYACSGSTIQVLPHRPKCLLRAFAYSCAAGWGTRMRMFQQPVVAIAVRNGMEEAVQAAICCHGVCVRRTRAQET